MVVRRSPLRSLAGGLTGLVLTASVLGGPAASADDTTVPAYDAPTATPSVATTPDDDGDDAPLAITIDQLTPGALPRSGPLVVRGTITNVGLETWTDVSLYPMFGSGPDCTICASVMTTSAELEVAADQDAEAPVGDRMTAVQAQVAALVPGQVATYTLRIPQAALRTRFPSPSAGVYWFGVHALGASPSTPRDLVADGRARTFLPYVPRGVDGTVETAVVMPLRAPVTHATDGSLSRTAAWQQALTLDGPLGGPLAFGAASGLNPVTWLVDPAVLDAVRQLARRNLPRDVAPAPDPEDPSPSDEPSEDEESDEGAADEPGLAADHPLVSAATSWLLQAKAVLPGDTVAALPYGDPDLSAAARHLPSLYGTARAHASAELDDWGVEPLSAVTGPDGYLSAAGIETVDDGAVVLLGDQVFPTESFSDRPPSDGLIGERPVVVTATTAATGGPGPDPVTAAVALRQRILSEAAIRLVTAKDQVPEPLVVVLPETVTANDAAAFWEGLAVPWLDLTSLREMVAAAQPTEGPGTDARQIDAGALSYPKAQTKDEVSSSVLIEAGQLIRAARSFQAILGEDYDIGEELVAEALAGTSYALRGDTEASARLTRTRQWIEDQLGQVTIDAPNGVTLSGTSGGFSVSVRNALPYPVTINVAASTDQSARIGVANPVRLAANSRTSVPITADMSRTGVHNVTLRVTDPDGVAIGADDALPLRSGQVGVVIWIIIGTGAAILFLAIGIRLVRRFRRHAGQDPEQDAEQDAEALEATS
ncbi:MULTISPECIES: DUF6049 family protein [unclassified Nocardioides]|uniref:DUF6049 family protein n=1 Tax=unclassified Nocardioides TaxID=2615069 RepID=UPI0006F7B6FC|nr:MULTISPECIES: DUF6049 family protein [unclassified Nocardioides]KRA39141.1 hypothetical protein ASD81_11465 [Nocardioides sp. Root614]KRA93100.1 hypothetical protein ASD84_11730 [Nocardioides sp. Root682]